MDRRLIDMFKELKTTYAACVSLVGDIHQEAAGERDAQRHAEIAFVMNECNKLIDDLGKQVRKAKHRSEQIANLLCLNGDDPGPIRTEYVTASLQQKMAPKVPPRDTPEYAELCEHLGIPVNEAIRLHYPTLIEIISEAIAAGQSLPNCELRPEFSLRLLKRKEIDAGEQAQIVPF